MACVRHDYCHQCEKETSHLNGKCRVCMERQNRERIAAWNALTVEEKLQDMRKRIEKLEAGPPRY